MDLYGNSCLPWHVTADLRRNTYVMWREWCQWLLIHMDHPSIEEHLTRKGASRKSEWVPLSEDALEAFQGLKQASWAAPSQPLLTTLRIFYSKQMLLRMDWEWYFPKNKPTGIITQSTMSAGLSQPMKRTIIPPKSNSWHWNGPLQNILRNTCCTKPS